MAHTIHDTFHVRGQERRHTSDRRAKESLSRRKFLVGGGMLSAAGAALLVGMHSFPRHVDDYVFAEDADILNEVLANKHEIISVYQNLMDRSLIHDGVVKLVKLIQGHHGEQRELLVKLIQELGGVPALAKGPGEYANGLDMGMIDNHDDALKLVTNLERSEANAHIGTLPYFRNKEMAKVVARVATDEAVHWTALAMTLNEQIPSQALTFGG